MVWGFHSLCQAKVIHWVYWNQCLMELVGRWQCGICGLTSLRFHARREGMSCDWTWISRPQFGLEWLFGKKNIHWKDCCSSWSSNPFPLDAKNWLIRKGPDAGKDWRQKETRAAEDEMVGWQHWPNGHESELTPGNGEGQGSLGRCSPWSHRVGHDWATD